VIATVVLIVILLLILKIFNIMNLNIKQFLKKMKLIGKKDLQRWNKKINWRLFWNPGLNKEINRIHLVLQRIYSISRLEWLPHFQLILQNQKLILIDKIKQHLHQVFLIQNKSQHNNQQTNQHKTWQKNKCQVFLNKLINLKIQKLYINQWYLKIAWIVTNHVF